MTLKHPPLPWVGGLLAGGHSSRMGSAKAGLELAGQSFSARVLAGLAGGCDDLVALGHAEGVDALVQCLPDAVPDAGPLGGLLALLRSGLAEHYLVAACDQPHLTTSMLRPLASALEAAEAGTAFVGKIAACYARSATDARRFEPLPLAIAASALPALELAVQKGERRLMRFISALEPVLLPLPSGDLWRLQNVNTPEEYAAASGRLAERFSG